MRLTSYGAAEGVTGSCHLLEVGDQRVLLDCGIFQGRGGYERNEPPLPFDVASIDALVVSHAHLDHIGRIPLLVKEGFRGRIISTRPTYELARISLLDSARIMDSDAKRRNRRRDADEPQEEPLYTEEDVLEALDQWNEHLGYGRAHNVCAGVEVTCHDAGHILGSAFLVFELAEGGVRRRFIFSGDLGNVDKPIINDPSVPPRADVVLMESTYGSRSHRAFSETVVELEAAVTETIRRGGNVLVPSFALERSQELLYVLYEAWRGGRIPKDVTIYLDSPMAIDATHIFTRHPGCFDADALALARSGGNPFQFPALVYSRHSDESRRINDHTSGAIIIAGSGMMTGGRILHHVRQNIHRPECSIVFCGYQGEGTLGRRIVNREPEVRIFGQTVEVAAQVHTIGGFSGHAGQDTLTEWVTAAAPERVLLVHGESDTKEAFATHLRTTTDLHDVGQPAFGVAESI